MKAILPSFLKYETAVDLVRVGRNNDGGYLIPQSDIEKTKELISFGMNDDWSFEKDFRSQRRIPVEIFDASVSAEIFFIKLRSALKNPIKLHKIAHWINVILGYRLFFSDPDIRHTKLFVKNFKSECGEVGMHEILGARADGIYLKIDIEGDEYEILNTICDYQSKLVGFVIEFHQCREHYYQIAQFIESVSHRVVHIHANNFEPIDEEGSMPDVLELTFSRSSGKSGSALLPHPLDQPNKRRREEIILSFLDT